MADPVTMAALTVATTAVAAGTSVAAANQQSSAAKSQEEWAKRQALETRASAQAQASEELRKGRLAQSRLTTLAGASGSGASDPTVMKLFGDISQEATYNSRVVQSSGENQAAGMTYQAALDRWTADSNKKLAKIGAIGTILGGAGDAMGQYRSRMGARYGGGSTGRTGYG